MTSLRQWFRQWFYGPLPIKGVVVYRALLSLWTASFLGTRLPYVDELFCRPVLRQPFVVNRGLGDPIPPVWLVQGAILIIIALLLMFAAAPFLPASAQRWRLVRLAVNRPRAWHLAILLLLSLVLSLDMMMHRGYGALAYLQWWLLWFTPYDRLPGPGQASDGHDQGSGWGIRLMQMQFCSVYLLTVLAKLAGGRGWLSGETLYYTLTSERWGQFLLSSWGISQPLAQVLSLATLASELFVGLGLWHARLRPWAALVCVGMHVGMALTLRVSLQFPTLMLLHLVLFVPAHTWQRGVRQH